MSFSPFRIKVLALALLVNAQASALAQEPRDTELRESVVSIDITLTDLYSRSETRPLIVTVFRPPGDGVHPVLIFNHGRPAIDSKFKEMGRQRFHSVARFFTAQGFVVMVPTRVGYGQTHSSFDPEYAGPCLTQQLKSREEAVSRQVMATLEFARTQDYVDASRWIVAGQSVGGFTAITVANRAPEGLVGAINFSGGYGGDPVYRRENPCSPSVWERALSQVKPIKTVSTLWLYWSNDFYFGSEVPRRWFRGFQEGGGAGKFVQFKDIKGDGHSGLLRDLDAWIPEVLDFLKTLPIQITLKAPAPMPPPSGFAQLSDIDKVPFLGEKGKDGYRNFITKDSTKAFAINSEGRWGWSNGQWDSRSRALEFCNRGAKSPCRLYAVNEDVVWLPK